MNVLLTRTVDLPHEDGQYARNALDSLLGRLFNFELTKYSLALPKEGYKEGRRQYAAEAFLPTAKATKIREKSYASMILTGADIFARFTNYVFGLADMIQRVAVVSSCRIHPSFWGAKETREFFEDQYGKVVTHEFGHTIGLPHCENWNCVMRYSNSPSELYRKGRDFCKKCARDLQDLMRRQPEQA